MELRCALIKQCIIGRVTRQRLANPRSMVKIHDGAPITRGTHD
ncbi:hypothetical protein CPL00368_CDS0083 [Klebsiella phage DevonBitter]